MNTENDLIDFLPETTADDSYVPDPIYSEIDWEEYILMEYARIILENQYNVGRRINNVADGSMDSDDGINDSTYDREQDMEYNMVFEEGVRREHFNRLASDADVIDTIIIEDDDDDKSDVDMNDDDEVDWNVSLFL